LPPMDWPPADSINASHLTTALVEARHRSELL
jgi:hypothetical protein